MLLLEDIPRTKAFNFLHIPLDLSAGIQVRISLPNQTTKEPIQSLHRNSTTSSRYMTFHQLQPYTRDILHPPQLSPHYHCHIRDTNKRSSKLPIPTNRTHSSRAPIIISIRHLILNNRHKISCHNRHRTWIHPCTPTLTGTTSQRTGSKIRRQHLQPLRTSYLYSIQNQPFQQKSPFHTILFQTLMMARS